MAKNIQTPSTELFEDPMLDVLCSRMQEDDRYKALYQKMNSGQELSEAESSLFREAFVKLISLDDISSAYRTHTRRILESSLVGQRQDTEEAWDRIHK